MLVVDSQLFHLPLNISCTIHPYLNDQVIKLSKWSNCQIELMIKLIKLIKWSKYSLSTKKISKRPLFQWICPKKDQIWLWLFFFGQWPNFDCLRFWFPKKESLKFNFWYSANMLQFNNYEIVVNFFHISNNLTWN